MMERVKKKKSEDNVLDSSDSDSDDSEATEAVDFDDTITSGEALTLVDDESPLLLQPKEEEGEGDTGQAVTYADYEKQYEFEGEEEGESEEKGTIESAPTSETSLTKKEDIGIKKKKKKKKRWLYICLSNCKYEIVRKTSRKYGFKEVSEDDTDWTLYWTDYSVALERVMDMKKYQKINHFPGMSEICRKDLLSRNLNRMYKLYPKEYNVFPKTWCLPADHGDFLSYTRQKKNKTYILKPETGCQGKGIWVTKSPKDIKPHEHQICQVYLNKPFLIDGFKFDLRLYVVVTSCDPLRIFLFKDGLARFATNKYSEPTTNNADNVYMHLTNYAINKHSSDFIKDDEAGSKRRITTIMKYLKDKGYDVDQLWDDIDDVITKTMISAHSVLKHNYRTCFPNHVKGSACFEILGFDILLDRKLRPLVLEVNHSPSFNTDAPIDREIKGTLIWDTLNIVNFGSCDRRKCIEEERKRIKDRLMGKYNKKESKEELEAVQSQFLFQQEKYEANHSGNLRRIYPKAGFEKYDKYFQSSGTLFQETAAFKARAEIARQQREEILRKKEKQDAMLKGRKKDGLRPESPNSRKRKALRRSTMPSRRINNSRPNGEILGSDGQSGSSEYLLDTKHPIDILEEEELERISGLLQRDNLVRGLGIVEHVYRLLHCTPGTMSAIKSDARILSGPIDNHQRRNRPSESFLSGRPPAIRIKDRQYYKKLLDRYFGSNHVLSNDSVTLKYERTYRNVQLPSSLPGSGQLLSTRTPKDPSRHFPQVRLSYSSATENKLLGNDYDSGPYDDVENESCFSDNYSFPERNKITGNRKYLGGNGNRFGPITVLPEPDYHNYLETDAERNRVIVRSSNDWRSDLHTSAQKTRVVSAQAKQVVDLPRFSPHLASHGLSVISAPAPVVQRPDLALRPDLTSPTSALSRISSHHSITDSPTRSTKSQRIRGASNNLRLRQMEMRENHAFVFS